MLYSYDYYRQVFEGVIMPYAFIDLDLLNENIKEILRRSGSKFIRIASKSIRCVYLLKKILGTNPKFRGVMSYNPLEALFLIQKGLDDMLIGYPSCHPSDIGAICKEIASGKHIIFMVDCEEHIHRLNKFGQKYNINIPVCLDVDMSYDFFGLHFGVWRSSIFNKKQAMQVGKRILGLPFIYLEGFMGYEAQIAGVADNAKRQFLKNSIIRFLKSRSVKHVAQKRTGIIQSLFQQGHEFKFINAGGTGSLESTIKEDCVSEVTVGSGFYAPALFDEYKNFRHRPAAVFALQIVRHPKKNIYTCHGGGYIASGAPSIDKLPKPYLPYGLKLLAFEGAGEVQTPLYYKGKEGLSLADPIFFRHAKAGELMERFNKLYLVSNGKIINEVPTYRGEGVCFL